MKDLMCGRCGVILKDTPSHFWNYHYCAERLELEQRAFEEHCRYYPPSYSVFRVDNDGNWSNHTQLAKDLIETEEKHHGPRG